MAGHNKWSKVKHIKGAADAKRSKLFSKLAKEISVAARDGGDIDLNARLRQAVSIAKKLSLPGDTIDRAIKKGTGEIEGASYEEGSYEGYGAGGIAFIVEVITDNTNRSFNDLRTIFNKNNGNLGSPGSVAHMFDRKGEIRLPADTGDEDRVLEMALEAGAEDVGTFEEGHIVRTAAEQLGSVSSSLTAANAEIDSQGLVYIPQIPTDVSDLSVAKQVLRLYAALDDYDDTQNVFSNFEIADAVMEQVEL
jgi:YebC/PmpR family DNA-binding regulatory protein